MSLYEQLLQGVPEYSNQMYREGYSPQQILMAAHKKIIDNRDDSPSQEDDGVELTIKVEGEVKR